jgi:hypothetical protein
MIGHKIAAMLTVQTRRLHVLLGGVEKIAHTPNFFFVNTPSEAIYKGFTVFCDAITI